MYACLYFVDAFLLVAVVVFFVLLCHIFVCSFLCLRSLEISKNSNDNAHTAWEVEVVVVVVVREEEAQEPEERRSGKEI